MPRDQVPLTVLETPHAVGPELDGCTPPLRASEGRGACVGCCLCCSAYTADSSGQEGRTSTRVRAIRGLPEGWAAVWLAVRQAGPSGPGGEQCYADPACGEERTTWVENLGWCWSPMSPSRGRGAQSAERPFPTVSLVPHVTFLRHGARMSAFVGEVRQISTVEVCIASNVMRGLQRANLQPAAHPTQRPRRCRRSSDLAR